jgi:serine/threonine protein kinase
MQQDEVLDSRYRLIERLGTGGMSVVWKAQDQLLNRPVAIKVLAGLEATEPAARLRIRAEAQAAAQLCPSGSRTVRCHPGPPCGSAPRSPAHSPPHTSVASSTAT